MQGVVAPKVRDTAQAQIVGEMIREIEDARGMRRGETNLIALIESPAGIQNAAAIAAVHGVSGLALCSEDLGADIGVAPPRAVLDLPCKLLALAAASRSLMALGAPISIAAYGDLDAYRAAIAEARGIGMNGVMCIHPAQVEIANAGFAPSDGDLETARAVIAAWDAAQAAGRAVAAHSGRMIDAPVVAQARQVLSRQART